MRSEAISMLPIPKFQYFFGVCIKGLCIPLTPLAFPAMAIALRTSLGDLETCGDIGLATPWVVWDSSMFNNPVVEIAIPDGLEQEACDSLLLMQLQAVAIEKVNGIFSQEYTVSVPLDEVERVSRVSSAGESLLCVRVRSSSKLFNEIMLRGAVGSGYSVRVFSTSSRHVQIKSRCAMALHVNALIRQGLPRVFVVQPSCPDSHSPAHRLYLSHNCIVSSRTKFPSPLPFRTTMQESALTELRNQVANQVAETMAAVLRIRHARIQRLVLLSIADFIMPQLFQNHGWVSLPSSTSIDIARTTTAVVLNANGFPAYAICPK